LLPAFRNSHKDEADSVFLASDLAQTTRLDDSLSSSLAETCVAVENYR